MYNVLVTKKQRYLLIAASEKLQVELMRRANKIAATDAALAEETRKECTQLEEATEQLRDALEIGGAE